MTKASDNIFPRLLISEGGSTSTPAAAQVTVYAKANGLLYSKDDAGTETALGGGGSVATDAIWDAAGDLVQGTGANTAAKLTVGSTGDLLAVVGGSAAWTAKPTSASVTRTAGNYTLTSVTFTDVDSTNLKLTIVTLARRVLISVTCTANVVLGGYLALDVSLDGTRLGGTYGLVGMQPSDENFWMNGSFTYITDALSAASHEFRLMYRGDASHQVTLNAVAANPLRFAVHELA